MTTPPDMTLFVRDAPHRVSEEGGPRLSEGHTDYAIQYFKDAGYRAGLLVGRARRAIMGGKEGLLPRVTGDQDPDGYRQRQYHGDYGLHR